MTIFFLKGYFSKTIKAIFPKLGRGHSWLKGFKFAQISQVRDYVYLIFFPLIFVVVSSYLSSSLLLLGLRWMIRVMGQLRLTIVIWHCYLVHRYNRKKAMHHIFALYRMTIIFNVKYQNLLQWHLIFRILSTTFASIKFAYNHHTPIIF